MTKPRASSEGTSSAKCVNIILYPVASHIERNKKATRATSYHPRKKHKPALMLACVGGVGGATASGIFSSKMSCRKKHFFPQISSHYIALKYNKIFLFVSVVSVKYAKIIFFYLLNITTKIRPYTYQNTV